MAEKTIGDVLIELAKPAEYLLACREQRIQQAEVHQAEIEEIKEEGK